MSNADSALESLAWIAQAVGQDRALKAQFDLLRRMSAIQRRNAIYAMVEEMRTRGWDTDDLASFELLADDRVYEAACTAIGIEEL